MSNVLKKIRELIKNKKFLDSLTLIDDIPNYTKNFELISLKGFVYLNLKEFKILSCNRGTINHASIAYLFENGPNPNTKYGTDSKK